MAIQLGRWDCPVCGQKGNLGNLTSCPSCGSPRGKDVEFYLPENAQDISDENMLKEANAGVDWICDYCGADNKAGDTSCRSCGNERNHEDIERQTKDYNIDEIPHAGITKKSKKKENIPEPPKNSSSLKKISIFIIGAVVVLATLFWPRSFKVEVVKHTWERSIEIENNRLVTEENWSMPAQATLKDSYRAIHHYDKVFDHYENRTRTVRVKVGSESYKCGSTSKGNGYFEDKYCSRDIYDNRTESYQQSIYRDVPVYQTKYRYTIYRWLKDHDINDKGNDKNARWPVENFKDNNLWREGKKTEKYTLFYQDNKGKQYQEEVDYNFWSKVNDGQSLPAKKNAMNVFYGVDKEKI